MGFATSVISGVLTLYLAFTNSLAAELIKWLPHEAVGQSASPLSMSQPSTLTTVPSEYERGGVIPSILIENAHYQGAAVADAVFTHGTATPEEALVNIYCTYHTDEYTRTTTGTGWFIHPDGVIVTNAHVAQTLLLAKIMGDSTCTIKTGNPATPTYTAALLYISPAWLRQNAHLIAEDRPRGTGERDYALLYVTGGLNNRPMPNKFPALAFATDPLTIHASGTAVTAAGYPAGDLGNEKNLTPVAANTTITELMTFGSNSADIFSIAGSAVGEHGASGGPVVNTDGKAIGMIVTKGDEESFGAGSLRALTLSYIDRTMREETGVTLAGSMTGNLPYRARLYQETMVPFLEQLMRWELGDQ